MGAAAAGGAAEEEMVGHLLRPERLVLQRRHDWPERLAAVITDHQRRPFEWGRCDCATLWLAAVETMTGVNCAAGLPPWYSRASAMRTLKVARAANMIGFIAARLPEIAPAEAGRGDLVYACDPEDPLAGPAILTGAEAQSLNEERWVVIPRDQITRAFRV